MSNEIFAHPNKYGYNLSINHPVIGAFYNDFFRRFKLSRKMGMGDRQRLIYEKILWKYLKSVCHSYDKKLVLPPISDKAFLFTKIIGASKKFDFYCTYCDFRTGVYFPTETAAIEACCILNAEFEQTKE